MATISALIVGLLFGFGLIVSGMVNPSKVLAFLDVTDAWDPSLAFVMAGAITVGAMAFYFVKRMPRSLTGQAMRLPTATRIDHRLIIGSALFGIGWGLVGFCPGPAVVGAGAGEPKALIFVLAMLAGMALFRLWDYQTKKFRTK
ncbi:MAG TPA: YeeE/YedE family protein [Gammaproteobacteria bacterium]